MALITRRTTLVTAGLAGAGLTLPACSPILQADKLTTASGVQGVFSQVEAFTYHVQRFLLGGGQMAKEYKPQDISHNFKSNGTHVPGGDDYTAHRDKAFADWTLTIDGKVARPLTLTLEQVRQLPTRTQITRHDCVEGWSAIGQWTGVPLGLLLKTAGVLPGARFVVLRCADNLEGEPSKGGEQAPGQYYESIDLADAVHPQTLIAHTMNGQPLPVENGAPLRLRVERQLGYKQAKYINRIEVVDSFANIAKGKGGYWEDRGYEWYAGI